METDIPRIHPDNKRQADGTGATTPPLTVRAPGWEKKNTAPPTPTHFSIKSGSGTFSTAEGRNIRNAGKPCQNLRETPRQGYQNSKGFHSNIKIKSDVKYKIFKTKNEVRHIHLSVGLCLCLPPPHVCVCLSLCLCLSVSVSLSLSVTVMQTVMFILKQTSQCTLFFFQALYIVLQCTVLK